MPVASTGSVDREAALGRSGRVFVPTVASDPVVEQEDQPQRAAVPDAAGADLADDEAADAEDETDDAEDETDDAEDETEVAGDDAEVAGDDANDDDGETEVDVQGARQSTSAPRPGESRRRIRSRNRSTSTSTSVMPLHKPDLSARRGWTGDNAPREGADNQTRAVG